MTMINIPSAVKKLGIACFILYGITYSANSMAFDVVVCNHSKKPLLIVSVEKSGGTALPGEVYKSLASGTCTEKSVFRYNPSTLQHSYTDGYVTASINDPLNPNNSKTRINNFRITEMTNDLHTANIEQNSAIQPGLDALKLSVNIDCGSDKQHCMIEVNDK